MDPDSNLRVTVTDYQGRPAAAPGLGAWLMRLAPRNAPPNITIALVSDSRIRALNRKFRRRNAVTDVLSFPPSDLAIATGRARRQARDAGHSFADELKVLALHGLLHLSGYDHDDPADRGRMERLERRLRAQGGLHEGLIERARDTRLRRERRSERAQRSEPRERSEPAKRRASERVGESEGRSPSGRR